MVFVLRPRFYKRPQEITAEEIRQAREDLDRLARRLRRDVSLTWWKA